MSATVHVARSQDALRLRAVGGTIRSQPAVSVEVSFEPGEAQAALDAIYHLAALAAEDVRPFLSLPQPAEPDQDTIVIPLP